MNRPAEHEDLRARLAALASDEAKLRKDLDDVRNAIVAEDAALMGAVPGEDGGTERTDLDAPEAIRAHVVDIEAELRALLDTVSSHRQALEALLRSRSKG